MKTNNFEKELNVVDFLENIFMSLVEKYKIGPAIGGWIRKFNFFRILRNEFDPYESYKIYYDYKKSYLINFEGKIFFISFAYPEGSSRAPKDEIKHYVAHILAIPIPLKKFTNKKLKKKLNSITKKGVPWDKTNLHNNYVLSAFVDSGISGFKKFQGIERVVFSNFNDLQNFFIAKVESELKKM